MTKARDLANASTALSAVSATELAFVDGVTSAIQTQIDAKIGSASAINPTIVDAKGDIIAATAADTVARLAVGANGTVLTAASGQATGLEWATPSSGSMTLISTTALSGASVTLSSISQSFKSLYLVIYGVTNATANGQFYVNPNSDTSNNAWQALILGTGEGDTGNLKLTAANSNLRTNADNVWTITFNNYTSTTNYKTFSWTARFAATDGNPRPIIGGGGFQSNSAISSINILNSGGNLSTGTVELYGVK